MSWNRAAASLLLNDLIMEVRVLRMTSYVKPSRTSERESPRRSNEAKGRLDERCAVEHRLRHGFGQAAPVQATLLLAVECTAPHAVGAAVAPDGRVKERI